MYNFIKSFTVSSLIILLIGCSAKSKITYLDKSYQTDTVTVDLQIPQLTGIGDKDFESSVNTAIQDICDGFLNKFKEATKETPFPAVFTAETKSYEHDSIISLVTSIDYYTQKPHNNSFRIAKTLNTKTSTEVALKDLFEGDEYIDFINSYLVKTIENNPDNYSGLWAKPKLSENQPFYITDDSLVVYYPPYELSYYSRGFVEFTIPLSDLSGYLTEKYRQLLTKQS